MADAVVIEHPGHAGGHLGAAKLEDVHDERFDFKRVLARMPQAVQELQLGRDAPRLIVAGGVGSHEQVRHWLGHGADAVQVGTAFAVTQEGDAHENFKRVLIEADPDKLAEFTSVAGLPARAVATPWLTRYLKQEKTLQANALRRTTLQPAHGLPDPVRHARRHLALRSVLHRPEAGGGHARRSRPRAVLPGRVQAALRQRHALGARTDGLPAAREPAGHGGLILHSLRPPPGTFRRRAGFPKY